MESKLVNSCRMIQFMIKIYHVVQDLRVFSLIEGRTDRPTDQTHSDCSAHLWVVQYCLDLKLAIIYLNKLYWLGLFQNLLLIAKPVGIQC